MYGEFHCQGWSLDIHVSLHLVKTGQVSVELGKALNKVEDLRLVADYKGDPIETEDAAWAVQQAQKFVQTMKVLYLEKE